MPPRSANPSRPIRKRFRLLRFNLDAAPGCDAAAAFVDHLEHIAVGIGCDRGLDQDEAYFLGIALREAVMNALRHGRRADGGGPVTVSFRIASENLLDIAVRDRGCGFDPAELADPLAEENVEKNCGRGIFYMRRFVDRVSFTFPKCGGVVVRLGKRLPGGSVAETVALENPPAVQQKAHRRP
jgi:serine/threonine-protein kinase RsbW